MTRFQQITIEIKRLVLMLVLIGLTFSRPLTSAANEPVRMARATWDTGWFQTEIYKLLLEELGFTVAEPQTMDNKAFYEAVARGEMDFWVNGWFPLHNDFLEPDSIRERVEILGYEVKGGAIQGYLIDRKTAEQYGIDNLEDFQDPAIATLFDQDDNGLADLIGCNPGWGCEQILEHHIEIYGLAATVEHVQGDYSPLMQNTVERYRQGEPVFFYTWTPNWTVGKLVPGHDVIWLEVPFASLPHATPELEENTKIADLPGCGSNPCQLGFPPNDIRVVANQEFTARNPVIKKLLEQIEIPPGDIASQNARILLGEDEMEDFREHARRWVHQNRQKVSQWLAAARSAGQGATASGTATASSPSTPADSSKETVPMLDQPLRVATKNFAPFVLYENRQYTGFSIELWNEIANEINVPYELYGVNSLAKLLDDVKRGAADIATAGIAITSRREQDLDFSHSYFESGLQIMVNNKAGSLFGGLLPNLISTILAPELIYVVSFFILSLLAAAHIIWLSERQRNPEFPQSYFSGIWESFWWAAVTVTTVGYGDKTPRGVSGRFFGLIWIFVGYFVFAYFTASVTTTVTIKELTGAINGPEDLPGHQVATVKRSTAAEYLARQGIKPKMYDSIEQIYPILEKRQVDAVVYDAPVLQHYASQESNARAQVVGLVFDEQSYGIALPHNSPYREPINQALLNLMENGVYQDIYERWFGSDTN